MARVEAGPSVIRVLIVEDDAFAMTCLTEMLQVIQATPKRFNLPQLPLEIECATTGAVYFLCLVWQEDWTANPLSRQKFIKGKLVYQKELGASHFYARPYRIVDQTISVPAGPQHEECFDGALPPDTVKLGWTAFPNEAKR